MAWMKLKSSVTNKTILMPEGAYNAFHKDKGIYTVIDEPKQAKQEPKQKQPKEATKNVETTQLNKKYEVDPSGEDSQKA